MKKQTIIIILILLTLFTITNANPYKDNTPDNIWEERFQQVLAQQEIQKAEFEKLKKNATEEVFYHEYGDITESYKAGVVNVDKAGLFTIAVKAPEVLEVGEKAMLSFRIGNMFNRKYIETSQIIDENIEFMLYGRIKEGLLSLIVPQGKIHVDYNNVEISYFQHKRATPKKLLKQDNMTQVDADKAIEYLLEHYFEKFEHEELSRFEEATKEVIENIYNELYDEIIDWAVGKIPLISDYYAATKLGTKIFGPYIDLFVEYATENKIVIEKTKLDLMKMMAKDRNEYNIFDVPIVLNEKVVGTEDPIMAMIINIPIEVKEEFESGDKMGFYFDGCLGEDQDLERSEYFEWDLEEWGSLSGTDDVEEHSSGDYARIEYEVNIDEEITEKSESKIIGDTIAIMRKRLDYFEYKNISVQKVLRDRSSIIRIDIPLNEYSAENRGVIERIIAKRGKIYFGEILDVIYSDTKPAKKLGLAYTDSTWLKAKDLGYDVDRWYLVREYAKVGSRKLYLDGTFLDTVNAAPDTQRGGFKIQFSFDDEGAYIFAMLTFNFINKQIPIVLDDIVLVAPVVQGTIRDGSAEIQGSFTAEEADEIAAILKSRSLPFSLIKLTEEVIEK